ncbi:MAG: hypothetical protein HY898_26480 [Deltaproteobacteria bacterium]|nr:hypothetical protein [Deltaproteobacteria bacterium]
MRSPLIVCAGCHRHFRASERACPFCAAVNGKGETARAGLAVLTIGAAVASLIGCSSSDTTPGAAGAAGAAGAGGTGGAGGSNLEAGDEVLPEASPDVLDDQSISMDAAYAPPPM